MSLSFVACFTASYQSNITSLIDKIKHYETMLTATKPGRVLCDSCFVIWRDVCHGRSLMFLISIIAFGISRWFGLNWPVSNNSIAFRCVSFVLVGELGRWWLFWETFSLPAVVIGSLFSLGAGIGFLLLSLPRQRLRLQLVSGLAAGIIESRIGDLRDGFLAGCVVTATPLIVAMALVPAEIRTCLRGEQRNRVVWCLVFSGLTGVYMCRISCLSGVMSALLLILLSRSFFAHLDKAGQVLHRRVTAFNVLWRNGGCRCWTQVLLIFSLVGVSCASLCVLVYAIIQMGNNVPRSRPWCGLWHAVMDISFEGFREGDETPGRFFSNLTSAVVATALIAGCYCVWRVRGSVVHVAAGAGDLKTLRMFAGRQLLLDDEDFRGISPLSFAAKSGRAEAVRVLLECGASIGLPSLSDGKVALHYAARHGREVTKILLDFGATPDPLDNGGLTPLHEIVFQGNDEKAIETMSILVKRGALIDSPDAAGWTPLHRVVELSRMQLLKALVTCGASRDLQNNAGDNALAIARRLLADADRRLGYVSLLSVACEEMRPLAMGVEREVEKLKDTVEFLSVAAVRNMFGEKLMWISAKRREQAFPTTVLLMKLKKRWY
jgi:hypothetical protein